MTNTTHPSPDNTAVRVALWRALHVQIDAAPHVFEDELGLALAAPEPDWQKRPDMSPFTRPFRASIVARARFVEDLVEERVDHGVSQYVILGAGLDTFPSVDPNSRLGCTSSEIDQPGPQAWKRQRLVNLGFGIPPFLHLVPVDFEQGEAWLSRLSEAGYDAERPSLVSSLGVSMYLTQEAIMATLRQSRRLLPAPPSSCPSCCPSNSWRRKFAPASKQQPVGHAPTAHLSSASSLQMRCSRWLEMPAFQT
ncbi:MAG: class I SAM-dependent methyltransferase [Polyangiaceae bacterium]